MTCEQVPGNPDSVLGFIPCLPFAYVNPGTGETTALRINTNDVQLQKSFMNRVRVDRFIVDSPAQGSAEIPQIEPSYILFDNKF
jgi:hypothetical protein